MKIYGMLAAALVAGLVVTSAGAAPTYVLNIENPSGSSYHVAVHDTGTSHTFTLATGQTKTLTLATQTPRVVVTGTACSASATPSIKTYVTLALKVGCKIETKAAGISGF